MFNDNKIIGCNNSYNDVRESIEKYMALTEYYNLRKCNVLLTDSIKNSSGKIATFGEAIDRLNLNRYKDIKNALIGMKGWKHCKDMHTSPSGTSKAKEDWFRDVKENNVPAFTLTSYAYSTGNAKEILNPYFIVDIDNIEVTDELFEKLNSLPFVIGSASSVSGEGVWSVVKFDMNVVKDKDAFRILFEAVSNYYRNYLDVNIDSQCKNINRLRCVSPFEFVPNLKYSSPFEFTEKDLKEKTRKSNSRSTYNDQNEYCYKNSSVPSEYQFRGQTKEDYYRTVEMPWFYKSEDDGRNYNLLWAYSNAICKCCGDKGEDIFYNYFPTTPQSVLSSIWSSSQNRPADDKVRRVIVEELVRLKLIDYVFELI